MSIIPNFPDDLLDLHHHWHVPSSHPGSGPGRVHPPGSPGGGLEFLQFHRDFVVTFHAWYDAQPFADQVAVAPWSEVPAELKMSGAGWTQGWADAETRLQTNNPAFNSADELGTFIELGIHNMFLHGAAAFVYHEPVVGTFHSPLSTYFNGIHGLVDLWWQQWETQHLPNLVGRDLLRTLATRLLGGTALAPSDSRPVDPWGPRFNSLTYNRTNLIVEDIKRLQR